MKKRTAWITAPLLAAVISAVVLTTASTAPARKPIVLRTDVAPPINFPTKWIHGSESAMDNKDPVVQVHWYDDHTVMMRENKAYALEANFMFLYFGNERVLLLDQGSIPQPEISPMRELVDGLIDIWCRKHGRDQPELIVANTHLHGDHYSAWNQFLDRPNTRLMGLTFEERMAFLGITRYPEQRAELDLGGRKLLFWGSPGHEESELSVYDSHTRLLCTGDMLYWGLLTIRDWKKWSASIARLAKFTDEFPVSALINCHVEMSAQGVDYPRKTSYQPDEPPMHIDVATLRKLHAFTSTITDPKPGVIYTDKIFLYHQVGGAVSLEKNSYAY